MRARYFAFFVFAATLSAAPVLIRCGRLIDVRSGTARPNATILVQDGRVAEIGTPVSGDATAIDLSTSTCLPGLIDVHDHLTSDPTNYGYKGLGVSVPRAALTGAANARATLRAGFTTVRNLGAPGYSDVALRDAINAGELEGPRLIVFGPALGITGGHCDENLLAPQFHYSAEGVADGPWAARAKVREVIKYGADVIKVCASGGVLSKGDAAGAPQYTPEEMKGIADEAHKLGRKVAAHAHGAQSIKDAILAGIDSIEHCSLIDDDGIRVAKQHGTWLVFDIYNDDFILQEGLKNGMLPESIARRSRSENCSARISARPISREQKSPSEPTAECIRTGTTGSSSPTWSSSV